MVSSSSTLVRVGALAVLALAAVSTGSLVVAATGIWLAGVLTFPRVALWPFLRLARRGAA